MTIFERNMNALQDSQLRTMLLGSTNETVQVDFLPAKNGEMTIRQNGYFMYSRYNPTEDVSRFIESQISDSAVTYCLFGFGLGYHIRELMNKQPGKQIIVIEPYISVLKEVALHTDIVDIFSNGDVHIICSIAETNRINWSKMGEVKWIIPINWLKSLPEHYPLKPFLENIKIKDMSSQRFRGQMEENFHSNIKHNNVDIGEIFGKFRNLKAVLVSAGPSLDKTVFTLKKLKNRYFILAVGAALRTLIENGITPDAVIISDPSELVLRQFEGLRYNGLLFALSTASKTAFANHRGLKTVIFQNGFTLAEQTAKEKGFSLLMDTGGSVATIGFELLLQMGFIEIILFGQDCAFQNSHTHSKYSSSNQKISNDLSFGQTKANDGSMVYTTSSLSIFRNWFERKIELLTQVKVWNVARKGAVIRGAQYVLAEKIPLVDEIIDYEMCLRKILWGIKDFYY